MELVEDREPRLLAFNAYLDKEATAGFLDTRGIQLFGPPNEATLEMIGQLTNWGVPLTVKPVHAGGVTRLRAG